MWNHILYCELIDLNGAFVQFTKQDVTALFVRSTVELLFLRYDPCRHGIVKKEKVLRQPIYITVLLF